MKFRIDDNLTAIATASGKTPEFVSKELCRAYLEAGIIDGDSGNWGETFLSAMTDEATNLGVAKIAQRVLGTCFGLTTKISDLILLGDGDCPYCGGQLKFIEIEGYHKPSHNYYDEPEYIEVNEIYCCKNCGERLYKRIQDDPEGQMDIFEKHNRTFID